MQNIRTPSISVLMPSYEQARFLARALDSLQAQSWVDWEAIIVDDGSRDGTGELVATYLGDARIRYLRLEDNTGLGHALNVALDHARAPLVAYLPSDDLYYRDHLAQLKACLDAHPAAVLACSGVRYNYNRVASQCIDGTTMQLVQCMHRRTPARWVERAELESDDLDRLFWTQLLGYGSSVASGEVSCEWVSHPLQRHRLMREPEGGINPFRVYYRVREPLRFHSTVGHAIDEVAQFRRQRERPATPRARDGLKILLVGELAYNADRVLALEEQGHTLYGLWMDKPYWYNTVGPVPFGHVEDLPRENWRAALHALRPDVIYGLLNWQAVPFAHEVLMERADIPFVWHFKEGPFICLEKGSWNQLIDLYRLADGQIFSTPEMRDWFDTVVPGLSRAKPTHVLDGDLPKRDWFGATRRTLLSERDGEIHTVSPGRPIGLHPHHVAQLAQAGIHLHFYGEFTHGQWLGWIDKARAMAPHHLHLHANVAQDRWTDEFSQYDAGWLHVFRSTNGGDIRRANWDDLNYPARMSTLAAAGLPMLQQTNPAAIVATQTLAQQLGISVFFDSFDELAIKLGDRRAMAEVRERMWEHRRLFTFDHHVPALVDFFRQVIANASARKSSSSGG